MGISHIFIRHLSVRGHSGCFYILAVGNKAAVSMGVLLSLFQILISIFLDKYPEAGFLDHMVGPIFFFFTLQGASILFSIATAPFFIPTNRAQGF